jgi:superfamily II DNA helicase RecQ
MKNRFLKKERFSFSYVIIVCFSTNETEIFSQWLNGQGFNTALYHSKAYPKYRKHAQDELIKVNISIIVVTIAFRMGIGKPHVRFVIHFTLPKSLEGYYQESGRS